MGSNCNILAIHWINAMDYFRKFKPVLLDLHFSFSSHWIPNDDRTTRTCARYSEIALSKSFTGTRTFKANKVFTIAVRLTELSNYETYGIHLRASALIDNLKLIGLKYILRKRLFRLATCYWAMLYTCVLCLCLDNYYSMLNLYSLWFLQSFMALFMWIVFYLKELTTALIETK